MEPEQQADDKDSRDVVTFLGRSAPAPPEVGPFVFRPAPAPGGTPPDAASPPAGPLTIGPEGRRARTPGARFRHPTLPPLPPLAGDALPDEGVAYFRQLLTRYWTFPAGDEHPASCLHFNLQALAILHELVVRAEARRPTWADLHQLELALLHVTPESVLRSQAWLLRARYREAVSPARFRQYEQSRPASWDDRTMPAEALRADQEVLLTELQRLQCGLPAPDRAGALRPSLASRLAAFWRRAIGRVGAPRPSL
jgi:hypothetical protein